MKANINCFKIFRKIFIAAIVIHFVHSEGQKTLFCDAIFPKRISF